MSQISETPVGLFVVLATNTCAIANSAQTSSTRYPKAVNIRMQQASQHCREVARLHKSEIQLPRAFLLNRQEVGSLWLIYKLHTL